MLWGKDIFDDPLRIIDLSTHNLKIACARVGLFDIDQKFADAADRLIGDDLWQTLPDTRGWTEYYIFNLFSAAQLSPLVFGANLIRNCRFITLSMNIRERLTHLGIDFSMSLGNLWSVFSNFTEEQIAVFLDNLPDQEDYIRTYLEDIEHDNYPVEHQGLYYVMTALQKALALENQHIPDFGGNYLMQAFYLFRHPKDTEIQEFV